MVQGIAARRKRYVEVEATFLEDGRIVPRAVIWHDGRRFPVRAVLGVRYDVLVGHAHTFLFHEEPRWFVEEIVYEPLDPLLDGGACAWGAD
ncbi:outer dense fiber protein 1 [Eggerthella sp.]|uniref:outer dense fiber protein 1 n=1 Tax=Eggerthella sp. TaxID=1929886 RepID=UPI002906913A|nr:outer dense fiber protein 1 [Eggerthella sp.]MDU5067394.1 outer dense fiber protein 1 [Eggerthella sp.]